MNDQPNPLNSTCPCCGRHFSCGVEAEGDKCWCMELPAGDVAPEPGGNCYCPECLIRQQQETPNQGR